jgi:YD repeat-containing protein
MTTLRTLSSVKISLNSAFQEPQSKKITYTYDSMNRRVAHTDENGTTQYLYGNPNHPFQLTAVRSPSGSLNRYH